MIVKAQCSDDDDDDNHDDNDGDDDDRRNDESSEHYRHSVLMVKIITVMKLNTVGVIVKVRCCDNDDDYNGIANDDDYGYNANDNGDFNGDDAFVIMFVMVMLNSTTK